MQSIALNFTAKLLRCSSLKDLNVIVPVRYLRKPKWMEKNNRYKYNNNNANIPSMVQDEFAYNGLMNEQPAPVVDKIFRKSLASWQKQFLKISNDADASLGSISSKEANISDDDKTVNTNQEDRELFPQLKRIVYGVDNISIRVKSVSDKELVEELAGVLNEIKQLKRSRSVEERLEAATQQVIVEMEKLKTSINLEDLDEAIERAMASVVDYNFAIDKTGNVIRGRNNIGPFV